MHSQLQCKPTVVKQITEQHMGDKINSKWCEGKVSIFSHISTFGLKQENKTPTRSDTETSMAQGKKCVNTFFA